MRNDNFLVSVSCLNSHLKGLLLQPPRWTSSSWLLRIHCWSFVFRLYISRGWALRTYGILSSFVQLFCLFSLRHSTELLQSLVKFIGNIFYLNLGFLGDGKLLRSNASTNR